MGTNSDGLGFKSIIGAGFGGRWGWRTGGYVFVQISEILHEIRIMLVQGCPPPKKIANVYGGE